MRDIPVEVMVMPLRFLPHREIVPLMLVSKGWQHVIRSTPSLWAALVLRVDADELGVLKKWLGYSGGLLVSITLTIPLAHESALSSVCTMLGPHLHRAQHLGIHGERISYCSSIISLLHIPAPNLISLDLSPRGVLFRRASSLPIRFDGMLNGNDTHHLVQVAPRLQVIDVGLVACPLMLRTVFPSVRTLSVSLTALLSPLSTLCFSQCPLLEHLIVKDYGGLQPSIALWPGHRLRSLEIHALDSNTILDWASISQYDVASMCAKQSQDAAYRAIMHSLADEEWQIFSLAVDYGLAVTAMFRSGERVRYLQSLDSLDGCTQETVCGKLMYEPRCLRNIVHLTLGIALDPYSQVLTGHGLPHLHLPALIGLTLLCGAPYSEGGRLSHTTLFDESIHALTSSLWSKALKHISLVPRSTSSSPFCDARTSTVAVRPVVVSTSLLARFISRKIECAERPELRVAAPAVSLSNDAAALHALSQLVSSIRYSL